MGLLLVLLFLLVLGVAGQLGMVVTNSDPGVRDDYDVGQS